MRFLVRLLGGIWLATLVVSAGFAYLDVREERQRQMDALTRRATLVGSAVAEASERLVTGITWAVVRWSVTRPIARIAEWTKQMKAGRPVAPPPDADESLFGSLATEVTGLARTLARARSAAEQEAQLRLAGESVWTEERLKQFVEMRFGRRPVFVVSNREPVSHVRDGRLVREQEPASGLVTALGPIMQACGGVWVAHGR